MRRAASLLTGFCLALQATQYSAVGVGSAVSASVTSGGVVLETGNMTTDRHHALVRRAVRISHEKSNEVANGSIKLLLNATSYPIHPNKGTCPPRWKARDFICHQSCKKTNTFGRSKNGQCNCATDEHCLSGFRCTEGSCSARPKSPCPEMWWEGGNGICFQGCPRDDQHRDGDGRCLCGQGLPNKDCSPGSSCIGGVCETPTALATSLVLEKEDSKELGSCLDFSGYYQSQGASTSPLGNVWNPHYTWNPGVCNTALPGPTGEDEDVVTLGLENNHGYELPSIIEDVQGRELKEVELFDTTNRELDRKCCQQCAITPLCQWWSREKGTGARKCKLGYSAGKHIKTVPQKRRGGWAPGPWCMAQFSGLTGTNVSTYTLEGNSDKSLDEQCCSKCSQTIDCHFWIRTALSSGSKIACHLMKNPETHYDHSEFRGGWRAGNPGRNFSYITIYSTGDYGTKHTDEEEFNAACWKAPEFIIRRDCSWCSAPYNVIYFRRYTFPKAFNFYYYLLTRFVAADNEPHTDFDVFSSFEDAVLKRNPWKAFKFGEEEVGFPGESGPSVTSSGQWNSLTKAGGATSVRYSIPVFHPCTFGNNSTITISQDPDNCDKIVAANPYLKVRSPSGTAKGDKLHMFEAYGKAITNISLESQYGNVGAIRWTDNTLWVKMDCYWFAGDYEAEGFGSSSVKCRQAGCEVTCMKEDSENVTGSAIGNSLSLPGMTGNGALDMRLEKLTWPTMDKTWRRTPPIP